MVCIAMVARLSLKDKMDFIHSLYDFQDTGELTVDELILMLRTTALGCQKFDNRIEVPSKCHAPV